MEQSGKDIEFFEKAELKEYAVKLALAAAGVLAVLIMILIVAVLAVLMSFEEIVGAALDALLIFAGIIAGSILMFMFLRIYGRMRLLNHIMTNSLKVSDSTLPEINELVRRAAERLGVEAPDVYVTQDPVLNAFSIGFRKRVIVLNSAIIEAMSNDELLFVIGHELSHIKYGKLVRLMLGGVRIPVPLLFASRYREYTCDRGGLIACRDLDSSIKALTRLALGKNLSEKVDIRTLYLSEDEAKKEKGFGPLNVLASHPPVKNRILGLRKFYGSEAYRAIAAP